MKMKFRSRQIMLHCSIGGIACLMLTPFLFVLNNSFRSNHEIYSDYFGLPESVRDLFVRSFAFREVSASVGHSPDDQSSVEIEERGDQHFKIFTAYRIAWPVLRPYMINTMIVSLVTVIGVVLLGSVTGYVLARYKFIGSGAIYLFITCTMMFPGVLTLIPCYFLIESMGLLNTIWAMILPYIVGGHVFAIFLFRNFFRSLPEELFQSARIDGAGHMRIYWNIVIPLSQPIISVVAITNVLSTWNNFLWPFITNSDGKHHTIASALYVLSTSSHTVNISTMYAAYVISSIPLVLLFCFSTRTFIQGIASGALKG